MKLSKLLFVLLIAQFLIVPTNTVQPVAAISAVTIFNASSYTIPNATLSSGALANIHQDDSNNMTFIETSYTYTGAQLAYEMPTEDHADRYSTEGDLGAISAVGTSPYTGSYALQMSSTVRKGSGSFIIDNGTTKAGNWDTSDITSFNFTIRSDASAIPQQRTELYQVQMHRTETVYAYHNMGNLTVDSTWDLITLYKSDAEQTGGFNFDEDTVNWIELVFETGSIGSNIWIDGVMGFYGVETGATERHMHVRYEFTDIGDFDNYALNVSAQRDIHLETDFNDEFFSEDITDWGVSNTNMTLSNDASNAQDGTNAMKAIYDDENDTIAHFDNGTSKNMQADFSNYESFEFINFANVSDAQAQWLRFYTNTTNYYTLSLGIPISEYDNPERYSFPLGIMQAVGSPSWTNISWFAFYINSSIITAPFEVWIDDMAMTTSEAIDVLPQTATTEYASHHHDDEYKNSSITLTALTLEEDGTLTVLVNDTLASPDNYNTIFSINYLYITAWNDDSIAGGGTPDDTTTTEPPIPFLPDIDLEGLEVLGLIGVLALLTSTSVVFIRRNGIALPKLPKLPKIGKPAKKFITQLDDYLWLLFTLPFKLIGALLVPIKALLIAITAPFFSLLGIQLQSPVKAVRGKRRQKTFFGRWRRVNKKKVSKTVFKKTKKGYF